MKTTNLVAWDGASVSQATGRKLFEPKLTRMQLTCTPVRNCRVVLLLLLLLLLDEFHLFWMSLMEFLQIQAVHFLILHVSWDVRPFATLPGTRNLKT